MDCFLVTILIILHNSSNLPELQNLTTKIQTTLTNWPEEKYVHFLDQSILNEQIGLSLNHPDYFDKLPIIKQIVIFNLKYWLKHEIKKIKLMFGNRFWFGDISNLCFNNKGAKASSFALYGIPTQYKQKMVGPGNRCSPPWLQVQKL